MATEVPTPSPEYMAEDIGYKLLITTYVFLILNTAIFVLFLVSRVLCAERNHWETWTIYPISYIFCLAMCICCVLFVKLADGGRHAIYVFSTDPSKLETWLKLQTATEFIYMAGVTFPKVAILMLYLRVFAERKPRIATKVVLVVVVANWVATGIIADFTICQPFSFKWDKTIDGHCSDLMAAYKYISIPNILTDLAILILPISTLYSLHMNRTRKFGIFLTFLAGGMGIITSIIRFVEFYKTDLESDLTYLGIYTMIYTMVEPSAYFICSCLPGIRPLVRMIYHKSGLRTAITSYYQKSSSSSKRFHEGAPLGNLNPKGRHTATVSTRSKGMKSQSLEDDTAGFIRLDESFHVDHSPRRNSGSTDLHFDSGAGGHAPGYENRGAGQV